MSAFTGQLALKPLYRADALADGLLDTAVALTLEGRRPEHEQSNSVKERWREQVQRALDAMQAQSADLSHLIMLGHIAFGAALGYLDFRMQVCNGE